MIYITKTLRITKLDDSCLQLESLTAVKTKTGVISNKWKRCGYYGDIKSALVSSLKKQLFNAAEEEIKISEVIAHIDTAESNILKAIQNIVIGDQNERQTTTD